MVSYRLRLLFPFLLFLLIAVMESGCIADPVKPPQSDGSSGGHGAIVLNEGLWRNDNSTLTYYDPESGRVVQDYFAASNPGLRLGDLGNSIVVWNGRAYITLSTSRTIEVMELKSGKSLGRILLASPNIPRTITIVDSTVGLVTTQGDSVIAFDPTKLVLTGAFAVGPAPEGIAYGGGKIWVANSGLGMLRANEPGAGTLSVYERESHTLLKSIDLSPNPRVLHYDSIAGKMYGLYGLYDSLGGVAEIDPLSFNETRRWRMGNAWDMASDDAAGILYVIGGEGVMAIDLKDGSSRTVVDSSDWPGTTFYSIAVSPFQGDIYIGTTKGFNALPGEILIVERSGVVRNRFPGGIYPGDFAFY